MVNKGRPTEIASQRELEKEFANIEKLFIGKETESNWEGRDASVKNLRSLLQSNNLEEHKDYFVQGLHNVMSGLIKSIHSLRTSVALEGLSLIADISQVLGEALDQYTMETILSNLLKCSSVTKKLIVTKSGQVTNTFLSHTPFYTKMMVMLCKTVSEKNVQIRQLSSNYLKTLLETHGSKEFVRAAIEKADALLLLDQFLKKGLIDAAPAIRDSCRSLYWAYQQLWEDRAEKLCKSLDATTQRQIEKSKSGTSTTKLAPRALNSRSNSASSLPSLLSRSSSSTSTTKSKISPIPSPSLSSRTAANKDTSKDTSTNTFKKPALKRSASAHAATTPPVKPISRPIPATSSEVRRNLNAQKMSRLSHISNASAPSATIQHKLKSSAATATTTATTRRSQSEFHQQSVLASASLLHMLKSNDTHMKCKGIRLLSERLKKTRYNPSSFDTILPPDVPTKIDLLPILMDTLSRTDWDNEVYQMLMSWESLAGIFVYVMSVNYYCPTLVIANEEEAKSTEMIRLYSKGLSRVKMFLKRNDAQLPQRLLDLLKSVMTDQNLLDSSVKRDMQLFPLYRTYLQRGLLKWMDELVCDYIGIPEDEDAEMLMEGSAWLHVSKEDSTIAGQWFDVNDHVQFYIEFVLKTLLKEDKKSKLYPRLCDLGGHLKMANQRVFEKELNKLEKKESTCIEKALGLLAAEDDFFSVKSVETVQTIVDDICSEQPLMIDSEMIEADNDQTTDSCGLTQPISNIEIKPQTTGTEEEKTEIEKKEEVVVEPLSTKVPDQSINNSAKVNPIIKHNFARPAPVARRISLEADYSISNKKRRKGNHDDGEPVVAVESVKSMAVLNFLSSKDEALLPKLQEISDAMSTQQGEEKNMQFWSRDMPVNSNVLFSLLDTVSQSLINSRDSVRSHAVVLINKLLDNQKEVFLFSKSSAYSKTIFNLSKALIITNVDVYDNISGTADKAIESIFLHICSIELALKTLWNLSKDEEFVHPKKTFSTHPLGTLFMYISKLAPKETCSNLENSLKNGAAETLVQGHNHSNVSVRKSCLQATIGIHKVLGDSYIHTYLSMLRTDQMKLLRLYLPKKNKSI